MGLGGVVGVLLHDKARRLENGAVVLPARLADVELGLGQKALEEVCANLESTGASQRLRRDDAALFHQRRVAPEEQGLDLLPIADQAVDREIGLGVFFFVPAAL